MKWDKDSEEHNYERNAEECTHNPIINDQILPSERSLNEIKGVEKKL